MDFLYICDGCRWQGVAPDWTDTGEFMREPRYPGDRVPQIHKALCPNCGQRIDRVEGLPKIGVA